jgi:hypothetical protein
MDVLKKGFRKTATRNEMERLEISRNYEMRKVHRKRVEYLENLGFDSRSKKPIAVLECE